MKIKVIKEKVKLCKKINSFLNFVTFIFQYQMQNTYHKSWSSLHFLDALNPLTGRNMTVPGFNAAHLGKEGKILGFEIFLIVYSLACVVINTGMKEI